jgi:hypothetical protein
MRKRVKKRLKMGVKNQISSLGFLTFSAKGRKVTSHSSIQVLQEHYIDPTIVSAIEKTALEVRIFGT